MHSMTFLSGKGKTMNCRFRSAVWQPDAETFLGECMIGFNPDDMLSLYKSLQLPFSWDDVDSLWKICEEKPLQEVDKKLLDLLHLAIIEAKELTYSMVHSSNSYPIFVSIMTQIALTMESVYTTSIRNMRYQSQILLRSLLELETLFLAIILDGEKRAIFESPTTKEKEKWYCHFRFPKLLKVIKEYEAKVNLSGFTNWVEKQYSELSSFTHADLIKIFPYSVEYLSEEDETSKNLGVADLNIILKDTICVFISFSILFFNILDSDVTDLKPSYLYGGESIERPNCYFWLHAKQCSDILQKEFLKNFSTISGSEQD